MRNSSTQKQAASKKIKKKYINLHQGSRTKYMELSQSNQAKRQKQSASNSNLTLEHFDHLLYDEELHRSK